MVKGPAFFKIVGKCEILGTSFENTTISYRANKILPIETTNNTIISLINEDPSDNKNRFSIYLKQPMTGTKIWEKTKDKVLKSKYSKILIIGPTDSGKSTITLFLANKLVNQGLNPLIIEGDVGQGDIAPPSSIGALILNKNCIDLGEIQENYIRFIGSIQPTGYEKRIAKSITSLYYQLNRKADLTIINLDGYVQGAGLKYKIDLIYKFRPDCILYLDEDNYNNEHSKRIIEIIHRIKRELKVKLDLITVKRSPTFIYKSQGERKEKRLNSYLKFLNTNSTLNFVPYFKIKRVYFKDHFHLSDKCIDTRRNYELSLKNTSKCIFNKDFLSNRFIGVSKSKDYEKILGFGLIKNVDETGLSIKCKIQEFDCIFLSEIKLFF